MTPANTVEAIYTIPYAILTIWMPNSFGNPFGSILWTAQCVNQITIKDTLVEKLTKPTGVRYKNTHHVDQDSFVTVSGLVDFTFPLQRNVYFVMYISWIQADQGPVPPKVNAIWRDRTYFGVTQMNRGIQGLNESDFHLGQDQQFRSQFFLENTGQGVPPGPVGINVGN